MAVKRSSSMMGGGAPSTKRRKVKARFGDTKQPARIAKTSTTLAQYASPFPPIKKVNLVYENGLTAYAPGVAYGAIHLGLNDAYDVDKSGSYAGNKQPLFYDALLSGTGPYRQFRVVSWKTSFHVVNNTDVPINVYLLPPHLATSETDLVAEVENLPGVKRLYLTGKTGSKNQGSLSNTGCVDDVYALGDKDHLMRGTWNNSPTNICYGGLFIQSADGTTAVGAFTAVKHEMYTELSALDSEVS